MELKCKQVINTVDGKCLGHITDIVFDIVTAHVLGFVVPQPNLGFWGLFKSNKELFIPYNCVYKIGVDSILVEMYIEEKSNKVKQNPRNRAKCCVTTQDNEQKSIIN